MPNPNEKPAVAQTQIGMTREDLLAILAEIRKPVKSEAELNAEAQKERDREAMKLTLQQAERHRQHVKDTCSHMRPNGTTTAVFILDLNKLYCQVCADWIGQDRPEMFNKLYQLAI